MWHHLRLFPQIWAPEWTSKDETGIFFKMIHAQKLLVIEAEGMLQTISIKCIFIVYSFL